MPFFVVCYEDNQNIVVTKDCSAANIVTYLTEKLPWDQSQNAGDLDLCDSSGRVIGLCYMGNSTAGNLLVERSVYYPVVLKDDRPLGLLLSPAHKNYKQLMAQVTKFCTTSRGLYEDSILASKKNTPNSTQDKRKKGRSSPRGKPRK